VETNFWIWLLAIGLIIGLGLGAMLLAYRGRGSVAVIFPEPIIVDPVPTLDPEAASQFQQGCDAYRAGQYRQAVIRFSEALQHDPALAEARHNLGRATANLRRITEAIAELVQASELYSQQDQGERLAQLKQDLEVIAQKSKLNKATPKPGPEN
jgi:tetratricopeptide (TPR) repeat protein